jgi:hypothetical protein
MKRKIKNLNRHYNKWIECITHDISSGRCPQRIESHIIKHATKDLKKYMTKDKPNWKHWSASMHNLMAIFDKIFLNGKTPTLEEKLGRLREKYKKNPKTHTPEPNED